MLVQSLHTSNNMEFAALWGSSFHLYTVLVIYLLSKLCVLYSYLHCAWHGMFPLPEVHQTLTLTLPGSCTLYLVLLDVFSDHPFPQAESGEPLLCSHNMLIFLYHSVSTCIVISCLLVCLCYYTMVP